MKLLWGNLYCFIQCRLFLKQQDDMTIYLSIYLGSLFLPQDKKKGNCDFIYLTIQTFSGKAEYFEI